MSDKLPTVPSKPQITPLRNVEELASAMKRKMQDSISYALRTMWVFGGHVKLAVDTGVYGEKAVSKLAKSSELSETTLYAYKRMYEEVTWEDLHRWVIPAGIAHRNLDKILRLPPGKRQDLLEKAQGLPPKELVQLIDNVREEDKEVVIEVEEQSSIEGFQEGQDTLPPTQEKKPPKEPAPGKALIKRIMGMHTRADRFLEDIEQLIGTIDNDLDLIAEDKDLYQAVEEEIKALGIKCEIFAKALKEHKKTLDKKA